MTIADVGILFNGQLLLNNSIVTRNEIREGSKHLFCITNRIGCCKNDETEGWILPSGNSASNSEDSALLQQQHDNQSIRLDLVGEAQPSSGVYLCNITDVNNELQHVYIGIYDKDISE